MEQFFDRGGPWGRVMMCSTASVQVCVDAGCDDDGYSGFRWRWRLLHALGPILVAAFANSPLRAGRLTGWKSTRQAVWAQLDPGRTRAPAGAEPRPSGDPALRNGAVRNGTARNGVGRDSTAGNGAGRDSNGAGGNGTGLDTAGRTTAGPSRAIGPASNISNGSTSSRSDGAGDGSAGDAARRTGRSRWGAAAPGWPPNPRGPGHGEADSAAVGTGLPSREGAIRDGAVLDGAGRGGADGAVGTSADSAGRGDVGRPRYDVAADGDADGAADAGTGRLGREGTARDGAVLDNAGHGGAESVGRDGAGRGGGGRPGHDDVARGGAVLDGPGLPAAVDPRSAWAEYALDAQVMCVRRGDGEGWSAPPGLTFRDWLHGRGCEERPPTQADLAYHLSTLFPPVRPQGHFEVRFIDAQPGDGWIVPAAVVSALADDPVAAQLAMAAAEEVWQYGEIAGLNDVGVNGTGPNGASRKGAGWNRAGGDGRRAKDNAGPPGPWLRAAQLGLADPVLARAARDCFEAADAALGRAGAPPDIRRRVTDFAEEYVLRGRCPADDTLEELR
jgi:hypothetical protein